MTSQPYTIYRDFDEDGKESYTVYSNHLNGCYKGSFLSDDKFIKELIKLGIKITDGIDNRIR